MVKSASLLRSVGVLSQLADEDIDAMSTLLREVSVGKDETVVRQNEPGECLYIVQSGRMKAITTDMVGRERVLGFYTDGQSFGEMALLTGEISPATVQAVTDSRLLVLRKQDFDDFQARNVHVMLQVMKLIAELQVSNAVRPPRIEEPAPAVSYGGGKVFTIFSPKGGTGKSTLAVNLAVALAHQHRESVVLVDLSLTFGHDLLLLNLTPKTSLASTTAESIRKMDLAEGMAYYLVTHQPSSLRILPGSLHPEDGETVTGETARAAIELLKRHFDYVVVDTSSTFTDPVLAALETADRVLILCSPEITVLRDLRECQRIFNEVVRLPRDKVHYLLNTVSCKGLSRGQFEDALQQSLYMEIPNGGDGPMKAALRGEALVETQSGSSIARTIQKLAEQLVAETATKTGAATAKKRGLFGW